MNIGNTVFFNIGNHRRMGKVKTINTKTVLVKMMVGTKSKVNIKRHIIKNKVRCYNENMA